MPGAIAGSICVLRSGYYLAAVVCILGIQELLKALDSGPEYITEFNAELLNAIVVKIEIAGDDLTFHLSGGLKLEEKAERRSR